MSVLTAILTAGAVVLLVPAATLFVECLASLFYREQGLATRPPDMTVAVLIPAHDEADRIRDTVTSVRAQLLETDRIVVVADNCTDNTAEVAEGAGATVAERTDAERRGKGYALAFGVERLAESPPHVVIVVDADCSLAPGSVDALVERATTLGRPVQADNVSAPVATSALSRISAFAMVVRNRVRPRGLHALGLPCHLMGTGMAFPWAVLPAGVGVGGDLAEDLVMGIDLAVEGHPAALCTRAGVQSVLPSDGAAALQQRRRWEHGHMATLLRHGPRLLVIGLRTLRPSLVVAAFDLMVPPLAMLVVLLSVVLLLSAGLFFWAGSMLPLLTSGAGLGLIATGVLIGWARYGRQVVSFADLMLAPLYLAWKLPLYMTFLTGRRERRWQRTHRD